MPIYKITQKGKTGYRYGKHGKIYFGKNAKQKAETQMRAIYASKARLKKK